MSFRDHVGGTTAGRLALLTSLYLSQGLPFGFFTQALPVFLREADVSLRAIGFTTLLALPWALKFLWAPFVDAGPPTKVLRALGHRRGFILPLQLGAALALLAVAFLGDSTAILVVLAAVLLTNLFAATQDIATDGLAIDLLRPSERGIGNGIQVAAYRAGMIIGGGAILVAFDVIGWMGSFSLMAALLLVATIPILLFREPETEEVPPALDDDTAVAAAAGGESAAAVPATRHLGSRPVTRAALAAFGDLLRRPGMGAWIAILVVAKFGDNLATGMVRPALVDGGFSLGEIGWMLGTVGFAASLIGALVGGALVRPLRNNPALLLFTLLQALAVSGYFFFGTDAHNINAITVVVGADHFFGGMATAALFTRMMDACQHTHSATDFTVQASVVVGATGLGAAASGFVAEAIGFSAHFATGAIVSLVLVGVIFTLLRFARPVFLAPASPRQTAPAQPSEVAV